MQRFTESLKKKYIERHLAREKQWPPVRREQLISLQLIETDKAEGFSGGKGDRKRTPVHYGALFSQEKGKKPVKKVLIEGHAGIGKTTLSLKLSEEWAEGEILQQFDPVLLLPLREKKVAAATSLTDLLKLLHGSDTVRKSVAEELEMKEGEGILILADGWDELDEKQRSEGSFLYDLFFGDVLPFASVLLTSRPSASTSLHMLPSLDSFVEIIGFNKQSITDYINSEFESDPNRAYALLQQLESNPVIQSVCSVPLNCAITCHLWRVYEKSLPSTMTEMYTEIILNFIFRDIKKKNLNASLQSLDSFDSIPAHLQPDWQRTCEFAFTSLSKDQIVFTQEEINAIYPEASNSDEDLPCFGLLQSSRSLLPVGYGLSFHFAHLTFQEYLAAFHFVSLPAEKQLEAYGSHAKDTRLSLVWRFVFGLGMNSDFSKKSCCLDQNFIKNFLSAWSGFPDSTMLLCHCAMESRSVSVSNAIAQCLNGRFGMFAVNGTTSIVQTPHDFVAATHVISCTTSGPLFIDLSGCGMGDKEVARLVDPLTKAEGNLQVRILSLSGDNLTNSGFLDLFLKSPLTFFSLERVYLHDNSIDGEALGILLPLLSQTKLNMLTYLNLSGNPLGVCGFQALGDAFLAGTFPILKQLHLADTLTHDADVNGALLTTFLGAISSHCRHLIELNLSKNNLGVPGAQAFRNLSRLTHHWPEFQLNLDETMFGNDGAIALSSCISPTCRVTSVSVRRNNIHAKGASFLLTNLCTKSRMIQILHLERNSLGLDGFLAILEALCNEFFYLKNLHVGYCDLSSNYVRNSKVDTSTLPQNYTIETLDLTFNDFSGHDMSIIAALIHICHRLVFLRCNECQLTSKDMKKLITKLSVLKSHQPTTPVKHFVQWHWSLHYNKIDNEGVTSLCDHLSLFPSLQMVILNGNPVSDGVKEMLKAAIDLNSQAFKQSKRDMIDFICNRKLTISSHVWRNWVGSASLPENEELREEMLSLWDQLMRAMWYRGYYFRHDVLHSRNKDEEKISFHDTHGIEDESSASLSMDIPPEAQMLHQEGQGSHEVRDTTGPFLTSVSPPVRSDALVDPPGVTAGISPKSDTQGPTEKELNSREHLREVKTAVWDVRSKWRSLGLELGVDIYTLDAISVEHRDRPDDCLTHVLQQWMDSGDLEPTWERLVQALEARPVDFIQLARMLRDKYCQSSVTR